MANTVCLFLVKVFHKIIVSAHQRLQPLYDCLLTIIVNISPYLKSLSMVSSNKLIHLLEVRFDLNIKEKRYRGSLSRHLVHHGFFWQHRIIIILFSSFSKDSIILFNINSMVRELLIEFWLLEFGFSRQCKFDLYDHSQTSSFLCIE